MVQIIRPSSKKRSSILLKAGLSIFLFLQIQMPQAGFIKADQHAMAHSGHLKARPGTGINKPASLSHAVAFQARK